MDNVVEMSEGDAEIEHIENNENYSQFLSFVLANEEYCVDILCVEEIRCWEAPTLVPNSPEEVKGVINLRGKIVPIVDLRVKFGVGEVMYSPTVVVIILKTQHEQRNRMVGVVVDAVSEVTNIFEDDIGACPDNGGDNVSEYMSGIASIREKVVSLVDVAKLLYIEPHIKEKDIG